MNKPRRVVLVVTGAVLALSLLFPPWVCWVSTPTMLFSLGTRPRELGGRQAEARCYRFIFEGPQEGDWPEMGGRGSLQPVSRGAHVDGGRLLAQLGALAVAGALAYFLAGLSAPSSPGNEQARADAKPAALGAEEARPASPVKRPPVGARSGRRWQL